MPVILFLVGLVLVLWLVARLTRRGHRRRLIGEIDDPTIGDAQRWAVQQSATMRGMDGGFGGP